MDRGVRFSQPHEDNEMNKQPSPRRTAMLLAAISGMILISATAQAGWLSPAFYGDDLDRCIVELRAELDTTGATGLQHTITGIDKVGVWYVFDIQTNIVDGTGAVIGQAVTHCKSHRFKEQTLVEVKNRLPAAETQLASAD